MKNKKTLLAIIGVITIVLVTIGITYAYWLVTKTQTNSNIITAGCLDITLNGESNDINLTNQFPLSDEEGMELVPYEFTVTNNCNTAVDYYINLESLGTESASIKASSLKAALDDNVSILGDNYSGETTVSGAYASHRLGFGTLEASSADNTNDSVTYELRLWIDADAPISEMNRTYTGKVSVTVGQGVNNILKEGTLAYDLVSKYDDIRTLDNKWTEGEYVEASDYEESFGVNSSYYWATDYEFDRETGTYKLAGDIVKATVAECRETVGLYCNYTFRFSWEEISNPKIYKVVSFTNDEHADTKWSYYVTLNEKEAVANEFGTNLTGMYTLPDDLGTSYYLRGDILNNYVKFGKWASNKTLVFGCYEGETGDECYEQFTSMEACEEVKTDWELASCEERTIGAEGKDMYWRIVRINGDGTIRLIYDGIDKVTNGSGFKNIDISLFSNDYLAGYTNTDDSGKQEDSTIKGIVDAWYIANLKTNYEKYIADSIFCNDKNDRVSYESDPDRGYYMAQFRLEHLSPKLTCSTEDRYTVNKTTGNGYLTHPVGLLTADEMFLAGSAMSGMCSNYLLDNSWGFWSMTPGFFEGESNYMLYGGCQVLTTTEYDDKVGVRPVINLKADVKFTGDGSYATPYEIVI